MSITVKVEATPERRSTGSPFADVLLELGDADERVVVLAADLGRYVDVMPFAEAFPNRYWNLGIAEANLIGVASGLAKSGFKPIVVTYGVFISRRAYDQVAMSLTTGPTGVVLVGFLPGITCRFRATHQPLDDVALLGSLPTMTVVDPADDDDLQWAIRCAVNVDHPTYIRALRGKQPQLNRPRADGAPVVVRSGEGPVGIIASGLGTQWALQAADLLNGRGLDVSVLHVPILKPFDREAVMRFCVKHDRVYTIENHFAHGGLNAAVCQAIAGAGTPIRIGCFAIPDEWPPSGTVEYIRSEIGLAADQIAARILDERRGE